MIRKLAYRIHPASVVAMLALFIALSGVSYAAVQKIGTSEIKNGAVTKLKIKKEAVTGPKIKQNAVTGEKVNEATLGIVPDAAKLAGKEPGAFESKGFGGETVGAVGLPKSTVTDVAAASLPAGTYLVLARGGVNNNSAAAVNAGSVSCSLNAGGVSRSANFGALEKNAMPGDREEFSLFLLATLPEPGDALLRCATNSGWASGNVTSPSVVAVSLQP